MSAPVTQPDWNEASWNEELRRAEGVALRRLCKLAEVDDLKIALRACEAITKVVARGWRETARAAALPAVRAEPTRTEGVRAEPARTEPPRAPKEVKRPVKLRPGLMAEIERRAARPAPFAAIPPSIPRA